MSRDALIVFVKQPVAGRVKTRLAPALSAEVAAELYRELAEVEVRQTAPRGDEYEQLFFFAPASAGAELEQWLGPGTWLPQVEGGLGERMASAFAECFRRGARRTAIIGTDVPWMSREHVLRGLDLLDRHDVVLGPALDGGYYLLALKRPQPELFEGVAWSTSSVADTTVRKALELGLEVARLDPLPDLDTIEDVRREWRRLQPLLPDGPLVRALEKALADASS